MLTYRSSPSGTLHAAYCGACRVGYVECRQFNRWLWQLSLIQPSGGNYVGIADDEHDAKEALERAMDHWLASAGLQHQKQKETARGHEEAREAVQPYPRENNGVEDRVGSAAGAAGSGDAGVVPRRRASKRGRAGVAGQ